MRHQQAKDDDSGFSCHDDRGKLNYINSIDLIPLLDTHGESIVGDLLGVLLMLVTNSNYLLSFINVLSGTC